MFDGFLYVCVCILTSSFCRLQLSVSVQLIAWRDWSRSLAARFAVKLVDSIETADGSSYSFGREATRPELHFVIRDFRSIKKCLFNFSLFVAVVCFIFF